ncbi:hypothetical protein [Intestinirhabdus alba]|jgi:hypothetical protein|uniref:Uncharacterized protein n=1 Tax=Intestinirhabdus alba TaxID=2899544 RepID=A0A6L6IQP0_9ENTR|nr:hypothetical protein [Intestinirhabdus alba]MTH48545.1 hypothetical protein [Intestinirhabdus alba]
MRKCIIFTLFVFLGVSVSEAKISPEIKIPYGFEPKNFFIEKIEPYSYNSVETSECASVEYKKYSFSMGNEKAKGQLLLDNLVCLTDRNVYESGIIPGLEERISYSRGKNIWVKLKNKRSEISSPYLKIPYKPIKLYNIVSPNARGFAVVSENILPEYREYKGIIKELYFCLVREDYALCGKNNITTDVKDEEDRLTFYFLKSVESMSIGLR